jgi:hypothetical protein
MGRLGFIFFVLFLLSVSAMAKVYYVSVDGSDLNTGDINKPFATVQRAQTSALAGDTVYIRGGKYLVKTENVARYESIWAYVFDLNKSGVQGKPIRYWAYPGEKPIFDFSAVKPANYRIIAFYVTGSYIHLRGLEVVGVQVTITSHTQSECFENRGSNNIYDQLSMHDGQAIGIYIVRGSNNLVLNCDAYNNYDYTSESGAGGNVDGFGVHSPKGHAGNVFRGCRAWFNSDDGYDCINNGEPAVFENCWAFYNGYSTSFKSLGDGNGFKAGGYGSTVPASLPNPIPVNTIKFCLAVRNKANGFYSNHHLAGSNWYNNSAYMNSVNYNMLNRESATVEGYLKDVDGYNHVLKNNLGYKARSKELDKIDKTKCVLSNNYFDLNVSVTDADFVSLSENLLMAPRKADGSLPDIDFMKLKEGSDLIDKGVDVGFLFNGKAPDLGAFESPAQVSYFPVEIMIEGEGSVTMNQNEASVPSGTTVVFNASAAVGWQFDGWKGSSNYANPVLSIVVKDTIRLTAIFSRLQGSQKPIDQSCFEMKAYMVPELQIANVVFSLEQDSHVVFRLYNTSGKLWKQTNGEKYSSGLCSCQFTMSGIPKGVYLILMEANHRTEKCKLIVV